MRRLALILALSTSAFAGRPEAERFVQEGDGLLSRRDYEGAIASYSKAIEEDPKFGLAWGRRGYAKRIATKFNQALEDFAIAIDLEPQQSEWRLQRIQNYLNLDRGQEAVEDSEALLKLAPQDPNAMTLHGWALARIGEVDRGLELQTKALQASGNNPNLRIRAEAMTLKGDWQALIDEMDQALVGGNQSLGVHFNRTVAFVEMGQFDKAAEAVALAATKSRGTVLYMCRIYLMSSPKAGTHYNPDQAQRDIELAAGQTTQSDVLNTHARALFLTGRVHQCMELLSTKGRRTNFETLFWLGAAYWKLGLFAEARTVLLDARRLNPYLLRHAEKVEGFRDYVSSIDRELAGEGQADRGRLGHELATHLLTVAEIEALVRRYQFARAADEYRKLLPSLKSEVRRAEVQVRIPEVEGMAGAHGKLIAAVNKGAQKPKTKVGKTELTIVKATDGLFDFTLAGGEGKFPWAYLDPAIYCELAVQNALTPEETFGLACLAWDANLRPAAVKLFEEALKKKPALKTGLASFVGRRRGIAATAFVLHRGAYVTPEEKANLDKGLVLFEGQWVTPKDREMLARGMIQVSGKWVPGEEAELLKRGYTKYRDKWMSREDYEALRGAWAEAYTEETAHYLIRSNESDAFAKDLAALIEVAYEELKKFYGGAEPKLPAKEKMQLWAFRTYEDYRRYCVDTKAESHLNAAGFAKSDSNTVVGWNKTSNQQQFLQTMVHEAAHLYFFRVAPAARPASWYAEAMATYFEGFAWDGRTYRFNFLSESRLPFVRDAMKNGRHIPLADMLGGDALALINSDSTKALLFYAQCWSLNYYLSQTDNKAYRSAYEEFRKAVHSGGAKTLLEFFPDAKQLEKDWVTFVTGL